MLSKGNMKLGRRLVWCFSIPAVATCPGRTPACVKVCYANVGFYWYPSVQRTLWANHRATLLATFADRMVAELRAKRVRLCRVHVAGDFYDEGYAAKWLEVMARLPHVRFYFYTRSWRVPAVRAVLSEMALLPNLFQWWSVDADTGKPDVTPGSVRLAYLMGGDGDVPTYPVDLFFRNKAKSVVKKVDKVQVCPVENGVTLTTCEKCQLCFSEVESRSLYSLPQLS